MGNRTSLSSPYPEEYFTITVMPPNIMWIAQSPPEVISSLRKAILEYWPAGIEAERHSKQKASKFMKIKTKAMAFTESNGELEENARRKAQKHLDIGINPMRNSVFRFNGKPFPYDSLDAPVTSSCAFAKMISVMWQILDTFGYQMISSGRFIKCIEASTCIFQRAHSIPIANVPKPESKQCPIVEITDLQLNPKALISFEGLNKLVLVNVLANVVEEIKHICRELWPRGLVSEPYLSKKKQSQNLRRRSTAFLREGSRKGGSFAEKMDENNVSLVLELNGAPWDSFKENSELSPELIRRILLFMIQSGYTFRDRASLRGFQDFWVFDPPKANNSSPISINKSSQPVKPELIGLLIHRQNGLRVYGSDTKREMVGTWLEKLIDDLWEPGVISQSDNKGSAHITSSSDGLDNDDEEKGDERKLFYDIRMHSSPWWMSEWDKDGQLNARFLVSRILGCLELIGYQFIADINLYRSQYDKAFLLFRYFLSEKSKPDHAFMQMDPESIMSERQVYESRDRPKFLSMLTISPYDIDKICISGCPYNIQKFIKDFIAAQLTATDSLLSPNARVTKKTANKSDQKGAVHARSAVNKSNHIGLPTKQSSLIPTPFIECSMHEVLQNPEDCIWIRSNVTKRHFQSPINDNGVGFMEFILQHDPWYGPTDWAYILKKVLSKRVSFSDFLEIQMPIALLLWLHHTIRHAVTPKTAPHSVICRSTDGTAENDEVLNERKFLLAHVRNSLVLATDISSCGKLSPPTWIFSCRQRLHLESEPLNGHELDQTIID